MNKSQKKTGTRSKTKRCPPKPPLPNSPEQPYRFGDFVHVLQKDMYYGRAIHAIVRHGRLGDEEEDWALEELAKHVEFPEFDLSELGTTADDIDSRCSNNTKFFMLDFSRFV